MIYTKHTVRTTAKVTISGAGIAQVRSEDVIKSDKGQQVLMSLKKHKSTYALTDTPLM